MIPLYMPKFRKINLPVRSNEIFYSIYRLIPQYCPTISPSNKSCNQMKNAKIFEFVGGQEYSGATDELVYIHRLL
jgi:hypothetical protein